MPEEQRPDQEFWDRAALAAMQALIAKTRHDDSDARRQDDLVGCAAGYAESLCQARIMSYDAPDGEYTDAQLAIVAERSGVYVD